MIITKTCNTCEHFPNDHHCVGCKWDKGKGENTKWELKKNPIVIERAVLDKIRDEIERMRSKDEGRWKIDGTYLNIDYVLEVIDKYRNGENE